MIHNHFHGPVGQAIIGDHYHLPQDTLAQIHDQWRRGEEFRKDTRIRASAHEQPYLQLLINRGVAKERVRELWFLRMLRVRDNELRVRSPSWLPLLGVVVGLIYAFPLLPLIAAPLLGVSLEAFVIALVGVSVAMYMGAQLIGPWLLARRLKPVVAEVTEELQVLLQQM